MEQLKGFEVEGSKNKAHILVEQKAQGMTLSHLRTIFGFVSSGWKQFACEIGRRLETKKQSMIPAAQWISVYNACPPTNQSLMIYDVF